jgi:hypothetical protein
MVFITPNPFIMLIEFILKEKEYIRMDVTRYRALDHWVDVRSLQKRTGHWLIEKKHGYQQTQLILTGVSPILILGFDGDGKLITRTKYLSAQHAPSSLMSTGQYVLLLPFDEKIETAPITGMKKIKEQPDMLYPDRPWTVHCFWRMQNDPVWGNTRFKMLDEVTYPPFNIPGDLYDLVDRETFLQFEPDRLALFVGTQMGVGPWYPLNGNSRGLRLFAVFGKSILSGSVAGLKVYVAGEGEERLVGEFV